MIINLIANNDLDSCYAALRTDKELEMAEHELYSIIGQLEDSLKACIEENYSKYTSRAIRIAYIQGWKDFYELCLKLKDDTESILESLNV
ncbi:MAG: hypothetical protein IJD96_06065 [Lachnospiraceae bacterium]|nr:hypothetical protein [Lachnospiraceae bacterium]